MDYRFNLLLKLKYSKTQLLFFTILLALLIFLSPVLIILILQNKSAYIISLALLIILLALIKPIENNWLYKTKIIGVAHITDKSISWDSNVILWKDVKSLTIKNYITRGPRTTVSSWKFSYQLELCALEKATTLYLSKKSIAGEIADLKDVLEAISNEHEYKIH